MKKTILPVLICFFVSLVVNSQETTVRIRQTPSIGLTSQPDNPPLFILDDCIVEKSDVFSLDPNQIKSISILKDSAATAAYGEKGKYGVILIRTRQKTEFLDLDNLLTRYDIKDNDRQLKICINNIQVRNRDKIRLNTNIIEKIEVVTDICWQTPQIAGPEETYLNIVTKRDKPLIL